MVSKVRLFYDKLSIVIVEIEVIIEERLASTSEVFARL